jgi:predicted RNA-binding Zn-ribbon protein involved in translation (DUF1610 family)
MCTQLAENRDTIQCKVCGLRLSFSNYSKSRRVHRICRNCDQERALRQQKCRQAHPASKPIRKVKNSLRKLRKSGFLSSKASSWLNVRHYEAFCKKWNNHSSFSSATTVKTTDTPCLLKKEAPTELVFWFRNMNEELSFENAYPCSVDELNTIVNKANGNTKVGVYMLANGDDVTSRKMLEKLGMPTVDCCLDSKQKIGESLSSIK